jgi:hypothetical protein
MWIRYEAFLFTPMSNLIPFMVAVIILAAFISGLFSFALHHNDHNSGASSFWLRRPLSTRKMAVARLNATALSIARVFFMMILIAIILVIFDWNSDKLDIKAFTPVKWTLRYPSPLEIMTMTILGLYGYALFYWTVLCLSWELLWVGGIVVFITWIAKWLLGDTAAEYVMNILFAGVPIVLITAFFTAKRRNLITTGTLLISAFVLPLAMLSFCAYPWHSSAVGLPKGLPDLSLPQVVYIVIGAVLPFIPVATTPLIMDKLRHR